MNRKVIYTAIFGDYNGLIPQPEIKGFDFICFTDNPNLKAKPWKIIHMEPPVKNDFTRSNRKIKLLPHLYLDQYDTSIYIDGNILIIGDVNELVDIYLQNHKMAAFSHANTTPDSRDCIYQEYQAILDLRAKGLYDKDDPKVLKKHISILKSDGYPVENGLIKGGCLVRKHMDAEIIKVMSDWWYMVENYSKRDQMSFNYVAWKNRFEFATIPGDLRRGNPYIYWLGTHRKDWSMKLRKIKWKARLGLLKLPKA